MPAGVLRVTGEDRTRWLHKLITAGVEGRTAGERVRAALLDARGHFIGEFSFLVLADSILLVTLAEERELLLTALRRYIFRERVKVLDESNGWALVTLIGPGSAALAGRILGVQPPTSPAHFAQAMPGPWALLIQANRATVPAVDILVKVPQMEQVLQALGGQPEISLDTLELLRLEAGVPKWGVDFDSNTLALEAPELVEVRVDQGCYIGQEVVARIVHRGHVNRRLLGLKVEEAARLPARGDRIWQGDRELGAVTSAARSPRRGVIALGYVRREESEPGTAVRIGPDLHARVAAIPFRVD